MDFGYLRGSWLSNSRPGPFLELIVPIWFVTIVVGSLIFAFNYGWIRFRLRSLFIFMIFFAGLFWLLMLRAPA